MTTQAKTTTGRIEYDMTIGISAMEGRGFYYPCDLSFGPNGHIYVANRSLDIVDRGVRVTMCDIDSEYYGTFGYYGHEEGNFIWIAGCAVGPDGRVFVSDEYDNQISVFDESGKFLNRWGEKGSREGQLDGPSGLAFDSDGNIFVSDTHNHRVQKFTASGTHLMTIASHGSGEGQLTYPWGVTVAPSGDVYIADWGNDRVARFDSDGAFVASYGKQGRGDGEFRRPSSVAVDSDGFMYIADWGNERVQVLDPDGAFVQVLQGEATLSKWAINFLNINNEEGDARSRADLELDIDFFDADDPHEVSSHIEKYFWSPMSVKLDAENRLYVTESNRHRVQIYRQK